LHPQFFRLLNRLSTLLTSAIFCPILTHGKLLVDKGLSETRQARLAALESVGDVWFGVDSTKMSRLTALEVSRHDGKITFNNKCR
jgi:hypothetical protein